MLSENHRWNILGSHFKKKGFVHHQIDSFNHFLTEGIENILKGEPPLVIKPKNHDAENTSQYEYYIINISNPHISKPTVIEETRKLKGFTPAEARRRNLNYDSPVYVNIQTKIKYKDQKEETCLHKRVVLCRIPIMLRSCKCYLETMTPEERIRAGECERDGGGYFIVKGNERTLVCQLRGAYNIPIVLKQKSREKYSYVAEIRSMSNETGHSVLLKACMGKDDRTLVLSLPYIKELIPIGIVMKALGVFSAKDIQDLIDLNHPKMKRYIKLFLRDSYFCNELESGFNFFSKNKKEELLKENPNIKQKEIIDHIKYMWETLDEEEKEYWKNQSTQHKALNYIGQFSLHILKENERVDYAKQVITSELFPHLGITSSMKQKKFFLGYILNKLISTHIGLRKQDDRDNYQLKRVESAGILCYELFRQLYKKYRQAIVSSIEKKKQNPDILAIVNRLPIITNGLRHSFATGNWGVPKNSYIRAGVSQILSRLSYGATLSNLRRINIPMGKESKNTKIRQIHPSQIMFICPVETPEGAPVGIVLNLSLLTKISEKFSPILVIENLEPYFNNVNSDEYYNSSTKIFINGGLVGSVPDAERFIEIFMKKRSANFLPYSCSISYNDLDDEISIFCDEGRLLRPVFTVSGKELTVKEEDGVDWDTLVEKGRIVYLDNNEINDKVIAFSQNELTKYHNDYCEIAPAMMMGIMGSMIPFPDHSQSPRNCYQAAMGKQAISMYALSHLVRTDTITHVLTYPQKPLVTTRAAEMMGFNAMPSGINAIVAVACYTGFNQEDSIILNYSAVQRGLFWATSYRTFVGEEKKQGTYTVEKFGLPPLDQRRHDANYSFLDDNGIIRKRHRDGSAVYVQQGDVIVGKVLIKSDKSGNEEITDSSLVLAKGEGGYVDRIFVSTNPNGYKLVKIVLRKTRIPEIGDKFASRSAQKGTCGMVYAQQDMPWTADGICPDIIINPHCLPSRMTINQLMETVLGKAGCMTGEIADATPFTSSSVNVAEEICNKLQMQGFDRTGKEVLYNGKTGQPMGSVFIGPVYYQRLKHMVSDKMHARAQGPNTTLTRQPLEGRSRDGGLRFGEMERDCMIAHGTSRFLQGALCDRSDPYNTPICEVCGNFSTSGKNCKGCQTDKVSQINIPYISKLVIQELNSMLIKCKIKAK